MLEAAGVCQAALIGNLNIGQKNHQLGIDRHGRTRIDVANFRAAVLEINLATIVEIRRLRHAEILAGIVTPAQMLFEPRGAGGEGIGVAQPPIAGDIGAAFRQRQGFIKWLFMLIQQKQKLFFILVNQRLRRDALQPQQIRLGETRIPAVL